MCKALGGFLIVMSALSSRLAAQDIAAMAKRVDSTAAAARAARQQLLDYRTAHPPRFEFADSAIVGAGKVRVYFNEDVAGVAAPGSREADRQLGQLGAALDALQPLVFSIAPDSALSPYDQTFGRTNGVSVRRYLPSALMRPNRTSAERDPKAIAWVIMTAVADEIRRRDSTGIVRWSSGALPLAPSLVPSPDWGALRLGIVSSPSFLGKSCFLGDVKACRLYLQLDSVADPARSLFDSTGRRLVVVYDAARMMRASRIATQRCRDGNDDACIAVLDLAGISALASPFVRTSLIARALTLGGDHAAERLVTARGSAGDALAAAANRPLDSLIVDWQHHLAERSGAATNLPLAIAISSIVWIAVCVFLALRSSRWR